MSQRMSNGRSWVFRVVVVAGLLGSGVQACDVSAPPGGMGQVQVRKSAATGAVCQPHTPCLTSGDDTVLGSCDTGDLCNNNGEGRGGR